MLRTRAGTVPEPLLRGRRRARGRRAARRRSPRTAPRRSRELALGARWTAPRARCLGRARARRATRPPARLAVSETRRRDRSCASRCSGTPTSAPRSTRCPAPAPRPRAADRPVGRRRARRLPRPARRRRRRLRPAEALERAARRARRGAERDPRARARRPPSRSRRSPRGSAASSQPFQWAGVRYVLDARRAFLADEQGLGKTVEALAALEADDAFPAVVVCPASLKLNWERETAKWLPHRSVAVVAGPDGGPAARPTSRSSTTRSSPPTARRSAALRPRALVVDESHYVQEPAGQAHPGGAPAGRDASSPDGLRLALTGTPVLNHAEELIAQLRVIGRLGGLRLGRALLAPVPAASCTEERLHWHLRRRCFVRRLKSEVLPQLPAKRQVVVPVALDNEREYRLAEKDVIAWLREQPLDLRELNARIAATLRAERLAQLGDAPAPGRPRQARTPRWPGSTTSSPRASRSSSSRATSRSRRRCSSASPTRCTCSAATRSPSATRPSRAFQEPDGPQLIVVRDARRRPGHHAHARVERRLPRARVDAGDARPGRGPLPPHRPARRGHRLVPAGRRHDRRDDGAADPAQARHRRRGDRRAQLRGRRAWSTASCASCATASRSATCAAWCRAPAPLRSGKSITEGG